MLATVLLISLVLVASVTDVRRHKIFNWTTYPGILLAVGLNGMGEALVAAGWATSAELRTWGWIGLGPSLLGFLVCGFVLLACFVFFSVRGGDVKLMAMLGAFLGVERGVEALLWTFVAGGCAGLLVLVWRVGAWRLIARGLRQLYWSVRLGRWVPLAENERTQLKTPLFLAPSALLAVVMVQFSLVDRL